MTAAHTQGRAALAFSSKPAIFVLLAMVKLISSRPPSRQMLAVRIDLEFDDAAVRAADFLLFQIDRQGRIGAALGVVEKLLNVRRRDLHRKNAVLETMLF